MKSNLNVLLFFLGILLAGTPATISAVMAQQPSNNLASAQLVAQPQNKSQLISQNNADKEIRAFLTSNKYNYWDARVLSEYWGQSLDDAKARVGRKILWGKTDVAVLDQYLVDARVKALQSNSPDTAIKYYQDSQYNYNDAEKLAKFWGDRTPWDAKIRIGRNLILGQDDVVAKAVQLANNRK
jgi:hypothetical protein